MRVREAPPTCTLHTLLHRVCRLWAETCGQPIHASTLGLTCTCRHRRRQATRNGLFTPEQARAAGRPAAQEQTAEPALSSHKPGVSCSLQHRLTRQATTRGGVGRAVHIPQPWKPLSNNPSTAHPFTPCMCDATKRACILPDSLAASCWGAVVEQCRQRQPSQSTEPVSGCDCANCAAACCSVYSGGDQRFSPSLQTQLRTT